MNPAVEKIKAVPLAEVFRQYGFQVNRSGFCKCPFHQERTASCKVYKDSFYCFGCHAHGDAIDFVKQYDNVDFREAVERLSATLGISTETESTAKRLAASRASFMRKYEAEKREREFQTLVKEFRNAMMLLRFAETAVDLTKPIKPEDEWSDAFCEAVKLREKLRIRADKALEATFNFDRYGEKSCTEGKKVV